MSETTQNDRKQTSGVSLLEVVLLTLILSLMVAGALWGWDIGQASKSKLAELDAICRSRGMTTSPTLFPSNVTCVEQGTGKVLDPNAISR
jgi:hypothetical protein